MLKIVLLGTGNLATHLFKAFSETKTVNVVQVFGRNSAGLTFFEEKVDTTDDPGKLQKADIYVCAVSDDAIELVAQYPPQEDSIVVHCSGAVGLSALPKEIKRGVFYPLQSFTKGSQVDFSQVPVCVEAEKQEVLDILLALGNSISETCIPIDSDQRKALHLAAVFANNFTNHLLHRASVICEEYNLPFSLLKPLIGETINKLDSLSPLEAQTGPARRGDKDTQQEHMKLISDMQGREIYRILSQAIGDTYGN
ncbi:DUF2520 domain-containing protein [Flavobacteriaceae bacterium D16]|nr:DUF2520 domain-containing protein [Flavobacteriaceae bacterium D16]